MHNRNGQSDGGSRSDAIRALNDALRKTFKGGLVVLSDGIIALEAERQHAILAAVQAFDDFTAHDDPWGEHDMAAVMVDGERIFFMIEYYDPTLTQLSDDPADASKTKRILTIMFGREFGRHTEPGG
jgi:Protein of unknown function (DUF3768)